MNVFGENQTKKLIETMGAFEAGRLVERYAVIHKLKTRDFEFRERGGEGVAGLFFAVAMLDDFSFEDLWEAEALVYQAIGELADETMVELTHE